MGSSTLSRDTEQKECADIDNEMIDIVQSSSEVKYPRAINS